MSMIMSGHCATPSTTDGVSSHERCARMGSGSSANPAKIFHPCPCPCHLMPDEGYECERDGLPLRETDQFLGTGESTFVHIGKDGRVLGEECP